MDFIKKHYEKITLSVVLLGLVGALLVLPFLIANDQDKFKDVTETIINERATPLPPLDLTRQSNVLERLQSPAVFDFSTTNKLFNPLEWKKTADGNIFPVKTGNEIVEGAVITKITPLNLMLTFDSVETNGVAPRYVIGVERQAAPNPAMRHKRQHYVSVGEKNEVFTLTAIKGDPENPDQLVLKLADTGEEAVVSKDKPFQRADAYMVDLKYPSENKNFPGKREGAIISFGGEEYNIVAIHQDEVILSAASNQKRTTLRYAP